MTDEWIKVAALTDVNPDTSLLKVEAFGEAVCLYVIEDRVYATQDLCTHGQACLSEGWLEDGTIECPLHQGVFDIASGKPLSPPVTEPLKTYETRVENGDIYLKAA